MGILNALGVDNGFTDWWSGNRNTIAQFGTGLAAGRNPGQGVALGLQAAQQGRVADDAYATAQKEEASRQAQLNQTIQFLQNKMPDLADALSAGAPMGEVWGEAMRRMQPQGPQSPIKASPGDVFLDPKTYQPISSIPAAAPKPTSAMQEYEFAKSQGYQGTFQQYETDMKRAGATNIDLNANQSAAAAYADRMAAANAVLSDPRIEAAQTDLVQQGMGSIPIAGNYMTSEERKMADQAQRDFINAVLRRESGAVISPSEFENARQQYFPQPGDEKTPGVIEQKRRNRELAIAGVARAAGSNYQPPPQIGGVVDYTTYFGGQ